MTFIDRSGNEGRVWDDIRVSIVRNGKPQLTDELLPEGTRASFVTPPQMLAVDLDDDADGEILVDIVTAGYGCCRRTVLFRRADGQYRPQVIEWDASSYRLANVLGGRSPEFLSADRRVSALYGSEARGPLRVLGLRDGKLVDLSRKARRQLSRDARLHARSLKTLRRGARGDRRPAVAAYAVDLVRLGRVGEARRVIRKAAANRELRGSANAFARRLDGQMQALGYATRRELGRIS